MVVRNTPQDTICVLAWAAARPIGSHSEPLSRPARPQRVWYGSARAGLASQLNRWPRAVREEGVERAARLHRCGTVWHRPQPAARSSVLLSLLRSGKRKATARCCEWTVLRGKDGSKVKEERS